MYTMVTVEQDEKVFALKITGISQFCNTNSYTTEQPKLLVAFRDGYQYPFKKSRLNPEDINALMYTNSKIVYVDKIVNFNLKSLNSHFTY